MVWLCKPYKYGMLVCMKKTLNIDDKLLRDAKTACGATTDTETVRRGLQALVSHAAAQRLRTFRGSEPDAQDVPRRRERASRKHRARFAAMAEELGVAYRPGADLPTNGQQR